jgi:hypothetical protein
LDNTKTPHGHLNQWNKDYANGQDKTKDIGIHDRIMGVAVMAILRRHTGQDFIDCFNVEIAS